MIYDLKNEYFNNLKKLREIKLKENKLKDELNKLSFPHRLLMERNFEIEEIIYKYNLKKK